MPNVVGASSKTIVSYEKTFCQFFEYCTSDKKIKVGKFDIQQITPQLIMDFLQHIEDAGNSISTRNQRHAALRSFFRYLQLIEPKYILHSQNILSIKLKHYKKSTVNYLTIDSMKAVLKQPLTNTKSEYRNLMVLTVLYDTAARVNELINIKLCDVRLDYPATIILNGKGNKQRIVPISSNTTNIIRTYINNEGYNILSNQYLFTNRSGYMMTSAGITYIVKKYTDLARISMPNIPQPITPHCFRHSKAMHLLQSGVNLVYIRDLLGHSSIKSTEIYAKSDSETKRKILENTYPNLKNETCPKESWIENPKLFDWLRAMCK